MELYFCYYSYSRYSGGSFLDGLLLLLTVTLSELHKKPRTKDWVTGKNKLKNLCGGYHFFHCTPSFLRHFLSLSLSSPFPYPMVGILCDNTMSKRSEIVTLFQFSTSLLASLVRWYYFRLCFSLSCFASDLTLIKKTHILNWYLFLPFMLWEFCIFHHFADDTSLVHFSKSTKKLIKYINIVMRNLTNWLNAYKISLNIKITKLAIFIHKNRKLECPIKIKLSRKRL